MLPSPISVEAVHHALSSPSSLLPSIITSYDESGIPDNADEAFKDQVTLSSLISDPVLQAAFAFSAVAIILLFVSKAIVTQMDEAVQKTALEVDKMMKLKYPKKWAKFIEDDDEVDIYVSASDRRANKVQKIVEEMEVLWKEEPEFMERVMQDIERMKR